MLLGRRHKKLGKQTANDLILKKKKSQKKHDSSIALSEVCTVTAEVACCTLSIILVNAQFHHANKHWQIKKSMHRYITIVSNADVPLCHCAKELSDAFLPPLLWSLGFCS